MSLILCLTYTKAYTRLFVKSTFTCVVIWDRSDYIMEGVKQLNDKAVYKYVKFDKDLIPNLTGKSNRLFESLKRRHLITEKEF